LRRNSDKPNDNWLTPEDTQATYYLVYLKLKVEERK